MACGTALVLLVKGIFFDGGLHGYWGWIDEAIVAWLVWNAGVWFIRRIKGKGDVEVTTPRLPSQGEERGRGGETG